MPGPDLLRLHVVALPHTSTTKAYSADAFEEKCRKFSTMMHELGHEVYLYGGPDNEASCTEFVSCITSEEQVNLGFSGPQDYLGIDFNAPEPWGTFNANVIREMHLRVKERDIICLISGTAARPIAQAFPDNLAVEFGIGYSGVWSDYKVFESYAWRNYIYGKYNMDGQFFDTVIPNFFEVEDFPFSFTKDDYFLFIGRLNANKGLDIAQEVCKRKGLRLVVAGPGDFSGYGEYVGRVDPIGRGQYMRHATAVFVPTRYIPPFEGVHVEAMLTGTPVITTDFGVFSETVTSEVGIRCNTLQEFLDATEQVKGLDPHRIRSYAVERFSTRVVAEQYEKYFRRLLTLYGDGWYQLRDSIGSN